MVFDGDCGFCRTWVARWHRWLGDAVAFAPYQTAAALFPDMTRSRFRHAVQLILPDGEVVEGAEAVFQSLALAPDRRRSALYSRILAAYHEVPGVRPVSELAYRWVAGHRPALSRISGFLVGPPPLDPLSPTEGEIREAQHAAARRRRIAVAGSLGAALVAGGIAVWRWRSRRRL
jgi:predicted DCC family thiol-disulfide oxidoreductase YuxK